MLHSIKLSLIILLLSISSLFAQTISPQSCSISGGTITCGSSSATVGTGTVTSIATTSPITGGTITTTGTIACATCVTSASALTLNSLVIGQGSQASAITTTGTGVLTALGINVGSAGAFVTFNGALGTPSSGVATNITGVTLAGHATQATNTVVGNATSGTASPTALAVGTCSTASSALIWTTNTGFGCNTSITANAVAVGGITGLGTGVATWLITPSSSNLASAVTDETGSGALVFANSSTISTPIINGFTDASNAGAGVVGQVLDASAALQAVNITPSGSGVNVTSLSITAGDWEVTGAAYFLTAASTTVTNLFASIGSTSATSNLTPGQFGSTSYVGTGTTLANSYTSVIIPTFRISVNTPTTYYLVGVSNFAVSTVSAGGLIHARRVR